MLVQLQLRDRAESQMKEQRNRRRHRRPFVEYLPKLFGSTRAPGSDHWNANRLRNRSGQIAIESSSGAVPIHGSQQNFSCAAVFSFFGPCDRVLAGGYAPAANKRLEAGFGVRFGIGAFTFGVNRNNHRLRSKALRNASYQGRVGDGTGVNADLVRSRVEDCRGIVERADSPSDRERDEEFSRGAANGFQQRRSLFVRRRDIEQYDLICSSLTVSSGKRGGIPRIAQSHKR